MAIPNIDINTILSDPLLLVGTFLLVFGPLLFLISLIKFFRAKSAPSFVVPHHPIDDEIQPEPTENIRNGGRHQVASAPLPEPEAEPEMEPIAEVAAEAKHILNDSSDRTMVMPPYVAELQAGLEIAITQVKQLNRKVIELEQQVEHLQGQRGTPTPAALQPSELSEPPMDAADFTKKLLKVVEHVIVLEKEVSNLRSRTAPASGSTPATQTGSQLEFEANQPGQRRPPILPI